jgi:septum site-determining protein MinC
LACANRRLNLPELRAIQLALAEAGLELTRVEALDTLTLVPAAALGLETHLERLEANDAGKPGAAPEGATDPNSLCIHRGTLRSGDHLQVEGSLLLLGDVNPGARVSAAGDVRIWGRLRGVAHAGCQGNREARIVALQLRPLQLRIADAVARGPEDLPPPGFCEEAVLRDGAISIQPAEPHWPAELA